MPAGSPSLAHQRQERLLELLRTEGTIVVSAITRELGVSEPTVRRDINELVKRGLATRVHGGATLPDRRTPIGRIGERSQRDAGRRPARYTVGMMVPSFDYYWPSIIAGARAAAAEADVQLWLRSSHGHDDDRKQVTTLAATPGIDGLIVAPVVEHPGSAELLRWLQALPIPVVMAERRAPETVPPGRLEWVASDHAAGAAMAVRHLYEQGHRRIGLFLSAGSPTATHVRRGWEGELRALNLDPAQQLTGTANEFIDSGRDAVLDTVLEDCRRTRTTALIIHPDPPALSLVQHCQDAGVAVPQELAVVAYDDEVAHLGHPAVTAVRPPKQYVGRLAVELLVARLAEGSLRPAHRVAISPELIVRKSSLAADTDTLD